MKHLFTSITILTALTAQAQPGSRDLTFGNGGSVYVDTLVGHISVRPDDRILVVGPKYGPNGADIAMAQYTANGTQDATFGTGGLATHDIFNQGEQVDNSMLLPNGKVLVVGKLDTNVPFVARFNADGTPDLSFGSNAGDTAAVANFGERVYVAVQPDGKVLLMGQSNDASDGGDLQVVRFLADGGIDTGFGTLGTVTMDGYEYDRAGGIAVQPDGKFIVYGHTMSTGGDDLCVLFRRNSDGTPDASFGNGGTVFTDVSVAVAGIYEESRDVAVASDGSILVSGVYGAANDDQAIFLARYTVTGTLDASFGNAGIATIDITGQQGYPNDLMVRGDGQIMLGGSVYDAVASTSDGALVAFNGNGTLDQWFGTGGTVIEDFNSGYDPFYSAALQSDGSIIAHVQSGGSEQLPMLVRYRGQGPVGLEEQRVPDQLTVRVDHAQSILNITGVEGRAQYTVLDATGRTCIVQRSAGPQVSIDITGLAPGHFVVQVQYAQKTEFARFIK